MSHISFFGYEVLPTKTGQHEPPNGCVLHISQASLAGEVEEKEEVFFYVAVHPMVEEEMKGDPKKYCVCRLNREKSSVSLNLNFGVSDMVFFSIERASNSKDKEEEEEEEPDPSCSVHLTGYYKVVEEDMLLGDDEGEEEYEEIQKILVGDGMDLLEGDSEDDDDDFEPIVPPPQMKEEGVKKERKLRERKPLDWKALNKEMPEVKDEEDEEEPDFDFAPGQDEDEDDDEVDVDGFSDYSYMDSNEMLKLVSGGKKIPEEEVEEEKKVENNTVVPPPPPQETTEAPAVPAVPAPAPAPQEQKGKKKKRKRKKKKRNRKSSDLAQTLTEAAPKASTEEKVVTGVKRPRSNESVEGEKATDGQPRKKKRKRKRKKKKKKSQQHQQQKK